MIAVQLFAPGMKADFQLKNKDVSGCEESQRLASQVLGVDGEGVMVFNTQKTCTSVAQTGFAFFCAAWIASVLPG